MDLNLNLSLGYIPRTISDLLGEVSAATETSLKLSKLDEYVEGLENELRKIEAFKRELPLSMILLNDGAGKVSQLCNNGSKGGTFVDFQGAEKDAPPQVPALSLIPPMSSSYVRVKIQSKHQEPQQQQQTQRKQRRSWSQELHRRFVDALQQLGGSQG
ncbi:hypothetical protein HS088_TW14G00248 [Tripterygium wilfordii]|uniref:HHO5-like N-terminal domain-containing protein n=1 Tax=Tripterygium wilfordii TaxID=458696 RepID=A0A7J7CPS5_TRIWF|nr:hypothetical protein HS088_TW14G00248 [Tripterygium wilfordii]